ncbi:putative glycerol-3-phosphate 2-O-acyltransferase 6-like [Capsicum annuum]|nr:putative glycerol-3-phosphate 2-O-acyltransferase 6-like [Capsicum annuum]
MKWFYLYATYSSEPIFTAASCDGRAKESVASDEESATSDVESNTTDVESDATDVESVTTDVEFVATDVDFGGGIGGLSVGIGGISGGLGGTGGGIGCGGGGPSVTMFGKPFDELRSIMKNENIDELFKKSCFAYFLELFEDRILHFPKSIVYGILKRRIKYVGYDKDLNEGRKNMDEVWINYRGMPAWACEAIPPLRKQIKDYPDKVSHPRILRWLAATKSNKKYIKEDDLFNHKDDPVMHPWIVPTVDELGMTYFLTLGLVDTKEDPKVELIKKELAGATSIRRSVRQWHPNVEALHDQPQTAIDPGAPSGGVAGEVVYDGGNHPDAAATSRDYEHVGSQ